jgi:nucleotide-binding universal stress UspA family protein
MISKILVATDGSKVAWKSVEYAVELAKQTDATITLLYVIEKNFMTPGSVSNVDAPTHLIEPVEDYLKQVGEASLQEAENFCKKHGISPRNVIRSGHPVEEIIGEAEESKVDLIVLGSHGKSALKAAFIGSVVFGVIHKDTRIPVLIVRR